jgi:predicted nucleic acid-binding protein
LRSVVIADAGPLIALSRIDALDLLRGLFGQVLVTEEVRDEALPVADYSGKASIAMAFDAGWLACPGPFETAWQPTNPGLGAGERSAIAAALKMPGCLLIIDDRAGRTEAKSHAVAIIGTAAIIGLAKLQGLIPEARPVLERLHPAGYSIHHRIVETVLGNVGE